MKITGRVACPICDELIEVTGEILALRPGAKLVPQGTELRDHIRSQHPGHLRDLPG